jgi:hypothetical protein
VHYRHTLYIHAPSFLKSPYSICAVFLYPFLPLDCVNPFSRDRFKAIVQSSQTSRDGAGRVTVVPEIDHFQKRFLKGSGRDKRPDNRFQGIHDVSAAPDLFCRRFGELLQIPQTAKVLQFRLIFQCVNLAMTS